MSRPMAAGSQLSLQLLVPESESTLLSIPARSALEGGFPAVRVSQIAEAESWRKEVHRPATHTHKWWAQRLGTVFRAILGSSISEDEAGAIDALEGPMRLHGLTVYDPFAGSGTTLVEAAKAGAGVIGTDINPVATLVQRQALQAWDLQKLYHAYEDVEAQCREAIDRLHRTKSGESVLYYFWVALANCPECGVPVRLFSRHVFAQNAYPGRIPRAQVVCPTCLSVQEDRYDFTEATCAKGHSFGSDGAVVGAWMTCPSGHRSKVVAALAGRRPEHEMYAKLVLGKDGAKRYEKAEDFDHALTEQASKLLVEERESLVLPQGDLADGYNTRQAMGWGFRSWSDFFNDRQIYSLGRLGAAIRDLAEDGPEREALAALFSGTLEFNNLFCSFKGEGTGAVRHMFSHHILKPERTPLEAHPWGTPASSGSFSTLFETRLIRAERYKRSPFDLIKTSRGVERQHGLSLPLEIELLATWSKRGVSAGQAYVTTGDAAHSGLPDESVSMVVTDPPYMDNVHYSELADFFHAWLREIRPYAGYPISEATTRTTGEVQSVSPDGFEAGITAVWKECARVLRTGGLLAFTFHQARVSGWVAVMRGLREAGFVVTAIQPVKGEMMTSSTKSGASEPSNLDSIVVARKRPWSARFATSPENAAEKAEALLGALRLGGVQVGAGDVRSVIRGSVLSLITASDDEPDVDALCRTADALAHDGIARMTDSMAFVKGSPDRGAYAGSSVDGRA